MKQLPLRCPKPQQKTLRVMKKRAYCHSASSWQTAGQGLKSPAADWAVFFHGPVFPSDLSAEFKSIPMTEEMVFGLCDG